MVEKVFLKLDQKTITLEEFVEVLSDSLLKRIHPENIRHINRILSECGIQTEYSELELLAWEIFGITVGFMSKSKFFSGIPILFAKKLEPKIPFLFAKEYETLKKMESQEGNIESWSLLRLVIAYLKEWDLCSKEIKEQEQIEERNKKYPLLKFGHLASQRIFIPASCNDPCLVATILSIGDGLIISFKDFAELVEPIDEE